MHLHWRLPSSLRERSHALCVVACLRLALFAGLTALLAAPPAALADYDEAFAAYKRGDYATALSEALFEAQLGNPKAQNLIGLMYDQGKGVPEDDSVAVRWYRLAAEQGFPSGQYNLGLMYLEGRGVEANDATALDWFRKAAEQGHASGQNRAGLLYDSGRGTEEDDVVAVDWYRKAAEQGHASAQYNLGLMYEAGTGVARDYGEALRWMRQAAAQNHKSAKEKIPRLEERIAGSGDSESQGASAEALKSESPKDSRAVRRAWGDCQSDDPDRKISGCQSVIESGAFSGERLARAYSELAKAHSSNGDDDAAIAALTAAIEAAPEVTAHRHDRAVAYLGAGRYAEAIDDYGALIAVDPLDVSARQGRGEAWRLVGRSQKALEDLVVAYQTACAEMDEDVVRFLQEDLMDQGHYRGELDGVCGKDTWLALIASVVGGDAPAQAQSYALFDPDTLAAALVGVTYEAPYGDTQLDGPVVPASIVAPSPGLRERGLHARVVATMNGAEARSTLEFWIFRSVAEARDVATNNFIVEQDDPVYFLSTLTGERESGDGSMRFFHCARPHPTVGGPPPGFVRCAYWLPESQVWIFGTIDGISMPDEEAFIELLSPSLKIASLGEEQFWAKQKQLLQERERRGGPAGDSEGGPTVAEGLESFEQLVSELDSLSRGVGYGTYNSAFGLKNFFQGESVRAEPDGALRVTLRSCIREGRDSTDSDCAADAAWNRSVTIAALDRIDPEQIYTQALAPNGIALDPLRIGLLSDAEKFDRANSFALIADCESDETCVHYEAVGGGSRLYIPCPDQAGCTRMEAVLRSLVELASTPSFDAIVKALKRDRFPTSSVEEMRKARRAARSFAGRFSKDAFTYELAGIEYLIVQMDVELVDERSLVIINKHCLPDEGCETDEFVTRVDLSQIDRQSPVIEEIDEGVPFIFFGCSGETVCMRNHLGPITGELEQWGLSCSDRQACEDNLQDLLNLAAFASSHGQLTDDGSAIPIVGEPGALVSAIGALDLESVDWPAPFRRPDEPVVRMADDQNRADGLKGVVYFPMPQAAGMNAVMATVLDSPQRARRTFDNLPFLTEKSPKGVDPVVFKGEWTAPGVPVGQVACAYYPLSDPSRTNHHQCVFFDGASQMLLGTAVQGLSVGPMATVDHFRNAAIATGIMVWTALGQQMTALPPKPQAESNSPATVSPAAPQALVAALSSQAFLEDFRAALKRDRVLAKPFQTPQQNVYQESDPVSRDRGVVGRVVVVMNGEGSQNGVEFLIYETAEAADRHMSRLLITPESVDSEGNYVIKTYEIKIESVDREAALVFNCARSGLDEVQPRQLRCAYHPPGSRIAVTSYSYADAPVPPDSLAIIASNAGDLLDTAEAEARRVEQEVASAAGARSSLPKPGPSEDVRQQMAVLAGSVNRAVAGSRAFVAAEGGTVERLMVTRGAELDGNELLIDRQACLAFLVPGSPQGNECRGVDVMRNYSLAIDLAELDGNSITLRGIGDKNPIRGFAVQMDCAAGQSCARIAVDDLHAQIIAKSFAETLEQPNLYLTCATHGICHQLVEDMRALSKLAHAGAAPAKGSVVQSLVGAWQIRGLGIMEFREDGTYTFHQPAYGHAGTYKAANGVWSLSSETPNMPWEDGGTYRLIDQDTLELVGKLGPGTWSRTSPPGG